MTEAQFVTALFAAPFVLLSLFWLLGLAVISRAERVPVKARKEPRR